MHIYLFILLFSVSAIFLLASFFVKNSDEHDKYVYKLACAIIAFTFFFSLAPMAVDLTISSPHLNLAYITYTYMNVTDAGGGNHTVVATTSEVYSTTLATYAYNEDYIFGWVCQGFGYVALALAFLYALAMVHDLVQGRGRP